jgi:hypothetical protein
VCGAFCEGVVVQISVAAHLPGIHENPDSIPSTTPQFFFFKDVVREPKAEVTFLDQRKLAEHIFLFPFSFYRLFF